MSMHLGCVPYEVPKGVFRQNTQLVRQGCAPVFIFWPLGQGVLGQPLADVPDRLSLAGIGHKAKLLQHHAVAGLQGATGNECLITG